MPSQSAAFRAAEPSRWRHGVWANVHVRRVLEGFLACMLPAFIFFACSSLSAGSPYDLMGIPTVLMWLMLGLRLCRGALPLLLLALYVTAIGICLVP